MANSAYSCTQINSKIVNGTLVTVNGTKALRTMPTTADCLGFSLGGKFNNEWFNKNSPYDLLLDGTFYALNSATVNLGIVSDTGNNFYFTKNSNVPELSMGIVSDTGNNFYFTTPKDVGINVFNVNH